MITPDFRRDRYEGQMNYTERELLYNTIVERKCKNIWEVGTCRGGGSTYYIACALENLGNGGVLVTSENFQEFYDYARALYGENGALHQLERHIKFNFGNSLQIYPQMLADKNTALPDAVLIDGGERSMECTYQYAMFRPHMAVGTIVIFHDWDNGKTGYVRPILENDQDWRLTASNISLVVFEKVGTVHDQAVVRI